MTRLLLFCFLLFSLHCVAQYHGGYNDGNALWLALNQNTIPNIFVGGDNDGVNVVSVTNQNAPANIYTGGINDGEAQFLAINQNAITNIYTGGINDGVNLAFASDQNSSVNIYIGGINDGVAFVNVTNQNAIQNIYTGGTNDGVDQFVAFNQNSIPNIYKGGIDDGFASITVLAQNNPTPLPLILISFTGNWQANDAALSWIVSQDKGIDYYELERSIDGLNFSEIGRINSKHEDRQNEYDYLDVDAINLEGTSVYYRLKSWDKEGNFQYSAIVRLSKSRMDPTMVLYPNPTSGHFTLLINNTTSLQGYGYVLSSASGLLVAKGIITDSKTEFDISNYAAGVYTLSLYNNQITIQNFKIILTK